MFTLNTNWFGTLRAQQIRDVFGSPADDVRRELDTLARATKRSRSFIVNEAVATFVRERANYLRELDQAVKSAESGVGHSGERIFAWMHSWGSTDELPAPEPDIRPTE